MKVVIFLFFSILFIVSPFNDVQKKNIRSGEYDIECYVLIEDEKTDIDINKTYYWFKGGEIHYSQSKAGGKLLHKTYSQYYRSNQLAESGAFHYGLKDGTWKTWFENGKLKEEIEWGKGVKSGDYISYDEKGTVVLKGHYKNNIKSGKWINAKTKDTTIFKKGEKYIPEAKGVKNKKESFFKRLFKKKTEAEKAKAARLKKAEKDAKSKKKKTEKASKKKEKKSKD